MKCYSAVAVFLSLCAAACSPAPAEFGPDANQIAEVGQVPRAIKVAAAEMLHRCGVPARGRSIFEQWEARPGEPFYTLLLSHRQIESKIATDCLKREAKALGVAGELVLGEEPPPNAPGSR